MIPDSIRIGTAMLFLGDCRELLPLVSRPSHVLIADPPYGLANDPRSNANGRSRLTARDTDFEPIAGDDAPFDPEHLRGFERVVLWGANHFGHLLPPASRWLVWDKREGTGSDDGADCELAWTNLRGPARVHRQLWRGLMRRGEENVAAGGAKLHPHQKPIKLMDWCLQQARVAAGDTVVDPYTGSGTLGVACLRRGIEYVGIEIDPTHYKVAVERLQTEVARLAAQPELFPRAPAGPRITQGAMA